MPIARPHGFPTATASAARSADAIAPIRPKPQIVSARIAPQQSTHAHFASIRNTVSVKAKKLASPAQTKWAWALCCGAILALTICGFGRIGALASADRAALAVAAGKPWSLAIGTLSTLCYGWLGLEGMLEWTKSRRRLVLGLADAAVSNRFLMWGLFGISTTILSSFLLFLQITTVGGSQSLPGQLAMTLFGLVSAGTVILAFFPPERYLAWVRARHAGAGASAA